uniref:Uncharacterized protein n=1 Tax=Astatotilapia calliptera TaxID=8154 RepID=A0AAX7TRU9_ASTCA
RSPRTWSGVISLPRARSSSSVTTGHFSVWLRLDFSFFSIPPPLFLSLWLLSVPVSASFGPLLTVCKVKYLNAHTGIVFLRFPKRCYKLLWSALPFITSIETRGQKIPCFLNCLHVGGTIRTCQKFLIRYNTQQLHRMLPKCKSEEEKRQVRKAILSCSLTESKEAFEEDSESEEEEEEEE